MAATPTPSTTFFKTKKDYQTYKKTKKTFTQNIRKTRKQTNVINKKKSSKIDLTKKKESELGKKIIKIYNNNPNDIAEYLKTVIKNKIDNDKFKKIEADFQSFDASIQGRSGAIVGFLKSNPNIVVKIQYFKKEANYDKMFEINKKCLKINNKLNEVVSNNILNNLKYLNKFTPSELKKVNKHILPLIDSGFSDKAIYTLFPLVGFPINTPNGELYCTNLTDILTHNHIPILKNLFAEQSSSSKNIIKKYDSVMSKNLDKYFKALQLLQDKIEYINTDLKLNNVFIKKNNKSSKEHNDLLKEGLITNFEMLITDLEKSIHKLFDTKVLTYPNNKLKVRLADSVNFGLVYRVRYQCISDFNKKCPTFNHKIYDNIFMIVNLIVVLLRYFNIQQINENIPKIMNVLSNHLKLNKEVNMKMTHIISKNIFKKDKRVGLYLDRLIYNICKKM